jgi:hypothetical protein
LFDSVLISARRFTRRMSRLALAAGLTVACAANAFAKDSVPDWVKTAAAQPTPNVPKDADAVFLLEETSYSVAPDGTLTHHVRKVVRILRPQGRKYGDMYASFNNGSKLRYMHIWSIGSDGKEYSVKDNELSEIGTGEGFELYSDGRAKVGKAPAMDVGAIAAVEYERQEKPYENDIIWIPGEDVPVVKERLTLSLPAGYTFHSTWKGKPKADPVDVEHGNTLWEVTDQAGLHEPERAPFSPSILSTAPRMDIFYQGPGAGGQYGAMTGDWKSIGEWYERVAKDRNKPDAAISAKAQELVQGKIGFRERTDAIASFVQTNIRYVAIEIGIGGNQPHAAADTFKARYGDCKDKATLLSAMLSAVGIRSTWVLVDTERGAISSDAPSLLGNHMIAAIELPPDYKPESMYSLVTASSGKRFLIFDPTWEKTPFGHLESNLQGSDALLVDGSNSQVIRLPILKPEQNLIERKATFTLSADGTLSGAVREERSGDIAAARRRLFAEDTTSVQQKTFERGLASDLRSFTLKDLKAENVADLNKTMTVSYSLQADRFAQEMGPLLAVRPRVLGEDGFATDTKPRKVPYDLGETRQVQDDFTITLPPGFEVDELPKPVNVELGFASYRSESKVIDNAIHYTRTYTVREITLPASRSADMLKLSRTIASDEQSAAVLKHTK